MFYSPITSFFMIFYEINDFKEIQIGGSEMEAISMLKNVVSQL